MTKWVLVTHPIMFFFFENQSMNFWAVFIHVLTLCFKTLLQNTFIVFINFLQKCPFLELSLFSISLKLSPFFITTAPSDSVKILCTPIKLRCLFGFFEKKKKNP